jgi:CPA2 family monovalent cation:H+ antiporter-2
LSETQFLPELGAAMLAALAGGLAARLLRLPVVIGYLLAGVAVGPYTPGVFARGETVGAVAHFGVVLLMFAVGVQTSLKELQAVRATALRAGGVQIVGTILLGGGVGWALGWGLYGGAFLGCALALSSTAVMMRILEERGELGTGHGSAMLGILVVQDLAVVVMAVVLPSVSALASQGAAALAPLGLAMLKAALFVAAVLVLAQRGVPGLLGRVARLGSQELFLLTALCLCVAAASTAHALGLSVELGAFLAGLIISEEYAHEVFSQVRPLRDLFAAVFFVSIGMLLDPAFMARHWGSVLAVVLVIVLGKSLLTAFALYGIGWHGRTALIAGLGLAQIGEFSFVLATLGTRQALIPREIASVILSAALVTLFLAPFLYGSAGALYDRLNAVPFLSRFLNRQGRTGALSHETLAASRALILGGGRVGRYVSNAFLSLEIPHTLVDYDGGVVDRMRGLGVPVLYGDASSDVILDQLSPGAADLAVVALPEAGTTEKAVRDLRGRAPGLFILARVHRGEDIPRMRGAGADMVIHAEFEAAVEMIQRALGRLGVSDADVETYLEGFRQHRYREGPEPVA